LDLLSPIAVLDSVQPKQQGRKRSVVCLDDEALEVISDTQSDGDITEVIDPNEIQDIIEIL